jgi:hypothetical protein
MNKALLAICAAASLNAQSLDLYSELSRPDPYGDVVAPDRGLARREILSPAVARNGFASFHIVVSVPAKESYFLYVATNPLDACRVEVYKEHFTKTSQGWIPDRLTPLTQLPDFGTMPDPEDGVEGQTTRAYLLNLWIPPELPAGRFRLEVQLKTADWIIRPIEVRVMNPRIPAFDAGKPADLPPIEAGADTAALRALDAYHRDAPVQVAPEPLTIRAILRRNAMQDFALARSLDPGVVTARALDLLRSNQQFRPRLFGAEWYLRLRDYLYSR